MKKYRIFILSALLSLCGLTFAQSEQTTEPKQYLPEEGDFAFSISANPFTSFIGNLFNGSTSNGLNQIGGQPYLSNSNEMNFLTPIVSIAGKYMLTDALGVRINLGFMIDNDKNRVYTQDDKAVYLDPLSEAKVIDSYFTRNGGGSFSIAAEYRVGQRRVQGVFGGGLLYAFSYDSQKFSYGNAITDINQMPTSGLTGFIAPPKTGFAAQRYLSKFTDDANHYAGIVAFAGIEWFVAPKISLGAEVNIAAVWHWQREQYYTAEGYNILTDKVEEWTELESPSSNGFDFGTGNIGANLSVSFYF
jgi:hypothetical protein